MQRSSNLITPWNIQLDYMPISQTEQLDFTFSTSNTATETTVAASTTPVTLLAANADRKSFSVYNQSSGALYLKFTPYANGLNNAQAIAASALRLPANGLYEPPINFIGAVYGVFANGNNGAQVTEYV